MKCPFRINVEFFYEKIEGTESDYLEKGQYQEYADCYEDECPYYNRYGYCSRVEDE